MIKLSNFEYILHITGLFEIISNYVNKISKFNIFQYLRNISKYFRNNLTIKFILTNNEWDEKYKISIINLFFIYIQIPLILNYYISTRIVNWKTRLHKKYKLKIRNAFTKQKNNVQYAFTINGQSGLIFIKIFANL